MALVVTAILAIPVVSVSAAGAGAPPTLSSFASTPTRHNFQFPGTVNVNLLVSNQSKALVDLYYANFTNEVVLYDAPHNTSKVVQKFVPGGFYTFLATAIAAGGAFLLGWVNNGTETFSQVSLTGKVTSIALPLQSNLYWTFLFGNATSVFATAPGNELLELNPATGKVRANYTGLLPTGVSLTSLLPAGPRLYLGGFRAPPSGGAYAWFGYLTVSPGTVTSVSKARSYPIHLSSSFYAVIALGGNIFVGGSLVNNTTTPFGFRTVGGLLFEYVPSTGNWTNESWRLPMKGAGVFSFEPWHGSIVLSESRYTFSTFTINVTGGIYTQSLAGSGWINRTSLLPATFVIGIYLVTAESSDWYFSGGNNTAGGLGEVVAVRA